MTRKMEQLERKAGNIPLVLKLDAGGNPVKWINWQTTTIASFTGKIKWTLGDPLILSGGTSASTGELSKFELFPIVAVDDKTAAKRHKPPALSNRTMFKRDDHMCMYCGHTYPDSKLTCDHIIPESRGGATSWTNCITACRHCNHMKKDRTPEEAGMPLLAVPYTPSPAAHLILTNRKILACQMEFLKAMMKPEEIKRMKMS